MIQCHCSRGAPRVGVRGRRLAVSDLGQVQVVRQGGDHALGVEEVERRPLGPRLGPELGQPAAEVRKTEDDPWVKARRGMVLKESAEFRTGPRSAIRFIIPPDQTFCLDSQGTTKVLQAVADGKKVKTDIGSADGSVRLNRRRLPMSFASRRESRRDTDSPLPTKSLAHPAKILKASSDGITSRAWSKRNTVPVCAGI